MEETDNPNGEMADSSRSDNHKPMLNDDSNKNNRQRNPMPRQ